MEQWIKNCTIADHHLKKEFRARFTQRHCFHPRSSVQWRKGGREIHNSWPGKTSGNLNKEVLQVNTYGLECLKPIYFSIEIITPARIGFFLIKECRDTRVVVLINVNVGITQDFKITHAWVGSILAFLWHFD